MRYPLLLRLILVNCLFPSETCMHDGAVPIWPDASCYLLQLNACYRILTPTFLSRKTLKAGELQSSPCTCSFICLHIHMSAIKKMMWCLESVERGNAERGRKNLTSSSHSALQQQIWRTFRKTIGLHKVLLENASIILHSWLLEVRLTVITLYCPPGVQIPAPRPEVCLYAAILSSISET